MATRARRTGVLNTEGRTTRKFSGKTYLWRDLTKTKREAQEVAKEFRQRGKSARITKGRNAYDIWVR